MNNVPEHVVRAILLADDTAWRSLRATAAADDRAALQDTAVAERRLTQSRP